MNALQFFRDDLLLEVGRVAALRGTLRSLVLSQADALFSTRLGDQGVARVLMHGQELPEICQALLVIAPVYGVSADAVQKLAQIVADYRNDFDFAAKVANGTWTLLGGEVTWYGLYKGETVSGSDLTPNWQQLQVSDLKKLCARLERAFDELRAVGWAIRVAVSERTL